MAHDIVIAGGGFAGANAARELERLLPKQSARLILVNDVNFLLYTPLLPEAAAGTLEPRHVVTPLRDILKRTYLRLGAITGHDHARRVVELTTHDGETQELHYDQLLLAMGSVSRSLPIPGLDRHAIGFKSLADAIWLRNHLVETLEEANASEDPAHRAELLTYVFVGGGYAGLEALAELQDFAADAMESYPRSTAAGDALDPRRGEARGAAGDRPQARRLRAAAAARSRHRHPSRHDAREVGPEHVALSTGERIPTRTVVWTAGVVAHPSMQEMGLELDERGRVAVDDGMAVPGFEGVYAAGDCAAVPNPEGGLCPPTAQHAIRQARVAARNMAANVGVGEATTFTYRSRGAFVNLGQYKAVAMLGKAMGAKTLSGFPAWWAARTYHVSQIPGLARKLRAVADWTVGLPFRRDTAEVGSIGHPAPLTTEVYARGGSHRPIGTDSELS